jgi:magnesium transporter
MSRFHNIGAPPGTLSYIGKQTDGKIKIVLIQFNELEYFEKEFYDLEECLASVKEDTIKWFNVEGVHHAEIIEGLGKAYNIHSLTLEDIMHIDQRPKFEDYDSYLVSILKMITYEKDFQSEQLSLVLTKDTVISFQEPQGGDAFDAIRVRLRQAKGRVRKHAADYLFYALLDSVVDWYFSTLEHIGDKVEEVEEEIINNPRRESLIELYNLKREVIYLRKQVWPLRDMIGNMIRSESELISENTQLFFRDLHDHSIRIIETVETHRDLLSGMMDIYLNTNSNKMNEIVKWLTIMSSIFIPVTFIASLYGMNFTMMPGLDSPYGYLAALAIMLSIMGGLVVYFKNKKWM